MKSILNLVILIIIRVESLVVQEFTTDPRALTFGSLMGGFELRFKVIGFDADPQNNQILVGDKQCAIMDSGYSYQQAQIIRCKTPQTNINDTLLPFLIDYPNNYIDQSSDRQIIFRVKGQADTQPFGVRQIISATPILYQAGQNKVYDILDSDETMIKVMITNYTGDNIQSKYLQSSGLQIYQIQFKQLLRYHKLLLFQITNLRQQNSLRRSNNY